MIVEYDELLNQIIQEIVHDSSSGEYVCDTTLLGDYGIDYQSPIGLSIENEVNRRLTDRWIFKQSFKKGMTK